MAKKLTRTAAVKLGFEALKFSRTYRSNKYITYDCPNRIETYLIGKSGALRRVLCGKPLADSQSITGTLTHKAYEFVGRLHNEQPGVTLDTLRGLFVKVMDKEINPSDHYKAMK